MKWTETISCSIFVVISYSFTPLINCVHDLYRKNCQSRLTSFQTIIARSLWAVYFPPRTFDNLFEYSSTLCLRSYLLSTAYTLDRLHNDQTIRSINAFSETGGFFLCYSWIRNPPFFQSLLFFLRLEIRFNTSPARISLLTLQSRCFLKLRNVAKRDKHQTSNRMPFPFQSYLGYRSLNFWAILNGKEYS